MERICHTYLKRGDKTDYINYRGISLLPTAYKILSNILKLTPPYVDKIIGYHYYGFQNNSSAAIQISCILQILEKKWDYTRVIYRF